MIPHSKPTLGRAEAQAVSRVILSGQIAHGKVVEEFERRMASYLGLRFAVAVSSGTAALILSLRTLGVGPQDEVVIPSYVCSALLHAVRHVGAVPKFADIDDSGFNLSPRQAAHALTKKTKALIVPHLFGTPAPMKELLALGVPVIEDCAQSLGALIGRKKAGSLGESCVLSFYATKLMTTGEGGMFLTNSKKLADEARALRAYDEQSSPTLLYNFKMTDAAAAMGLVQLKRFREFLRVRRAIAKRYDAELKSLPLRMPESPNGTAVHHRYVVVTQKPAEKILAFLNKHGVAARRPVHRVLSPQGQCPAAERVWEHAVSLPIYPDLSKKEQSHIIQTLKGGLS